jgi:hypothetical protein
MPNKFSKKKNKVKKVKIMYGGLNCPNPNDAAYMMLGHGSTDISIKDVPDDCVYITAALCGNVSYGDYNFPHFFFNNKELVKNPCDINNFSELNRVFSENSKVHKYIGNVKTNFNIRGLNEGSGVDTTGFLNMHVSKKTCHTSATCPEEYLFQYKDATYEPCLYWFYKDNKLLHEPLSSMKEKHDSIMFSYSGLISADNSFEYQDRFIFSIPELSVWKYPMLNTRDINNIYSNSLYPTTHDILQKIKERNIDIRQYLKITDPSDPKYFDPSNPPSDLYSNRLSQEHFYDYHYIISCPDFVNFIIDNYSIKQSKLFEMFPGVHYNTACRVFYEPKGLYELFTFSKKFQRQSSVNNRQNLLDLYTEEDENGSKKIVNKIKQGEISQREEEEREIAQKEEAKEQEEREIAQREEQEYLQKNNISSVGEPPIFNYPQLGKWFGRAGKNKKTRRTKRSKKYYKNKTRQNNKYKNKTKKLLK